MVEADGRNTTEAGISFAHDKVTYSVTARVALEDASI